MNVTPEEFIEEFHERRRLAGLGDEHGVHVGQRLQGFLRRYPSTRSRSILHSWVPG